MNEKVVGKAVRTRWEVVAVAVIGGVVAALQVGKVPPALPELRSELGLLMVGAGWIASVFNLCGAVLAVAVALFAERIGAARLLSWGLAVLFVGGAAGAMAETATALLASRIIEGFGFIACTVAGPSLIVSATDPVSRHTAFGFWGSYLPFGSAIAMLAAPPILAEGGWRPVWWAGLFAVAGAWVLVRLVLRPERWRDPAAGGKRSWVEIRHSLTLIAPWLYAVSFVAYSVQYYAVATWLPTFLIEGQAWSLAEAALATVVVIVINGCGNLIAGGLMRRGWPRTRLLLIAYLGMALFAWIMFIEATPDILRVPAASAFCLLGGLLPAAALAGGPAHAREAREVMICSGVVVQGTNIGALLGAPILAVAIGLLGNWSQVYWVMIMFGALGLVVTYMLYRIETLRGTGG